MERRPPSAAQPEKKMDPDAPYGPRGFLAIGVFFVFGATIAAYAAVTLVMPGTILGEGARAPLSDDYSLLVYKFLVTLVPARKFE